MDIESAAVSAIKSVIATTDYLQEFIQDKDKEPSIDGHIYVYSNKGDNHPKNELIGKVPVQVKGEKGKNLSRKTIKHKAYIADLRNFRMMGGALFFIVRIDKDDHKKIYYAALLPYVINLVLKAAKPKQKQISLTFSEFPTAKNEISNLVIDFSRDMKKQEILKDGEYSLEQAAKEFDIRKMKFGMSYTGIGYTRGDLGDYMLNHEMYFYASNQEGNINVVLDHIENVSSVITKLPYAVKTGEETFYQCYCVEHTHEGKALLVGKSFKFKITGNSIRFNYKLQGNLDEQVHDLQFLLAMFNNRNIYFGNTKLTITPTEKELKAFPLDYSKRHLHDLLRVKKVLELLHIKKSLEIESLDNKGAQYLQMLVHAFDDGKSISFDERLKQTIAPVDVGNMKILLYFEPIGEREYVLHDFFSTIIPVTTKNENGEMIPTSQFTILKKDDYIHVDNINLQEIIRDMKQYQSIEHYSRVNQSVLEMLNAFDECKNVDYLSASRDLLSWLSESNPSDKDLYTVNLYQCYLRERPLSIKEKQELYRMLNNYEDNYYMTAGISLLLGEVDEAAKCLKKLPENTLKEFRTYPIYRLYEVSDKLGGKQCRQ